MRFMVQGDGFDMNHKRLFVEYAMSDDKRFIEVRFKDEDGRVVEATTYMR